MASRQKGNLKSTCSPSGQSIRGGARIRDKMVPKDVVWISFPLCHRRSLSVDLNKATQCIAAAAAAAAAADDDDDDDDDDVVVVIIVLSTIQGRKNKLTQNYMDVI
ncbi:hypothetical protein PoB_001244900 [Plakobranchus ocellatus]|uniref:Uncharacterized protein n=1 Tax=Plakobranchus ocellatus TaxID=259542 RepID=A0AAV3YW53_9GAST|nr:hypothetical protein PoB_001244900 [Plakobranchus ocellatus]